MGEDEVTLVFRKPEPSIIQPAGLGDVGEVTVAKLSDLLKWFKGYHVDSIELSIEASAKSEGIVKLFVSAEGKGGMKITLKPSED